MIMNVIRTQVERISHPQDINLTQFINKTITIRTNDSVLAMGLFKGWHWKMTIPEPDRYGRLRTPPRSQLVLQFDGYEVPMEDTGYGRAYGYEVEVWELAPND